jgi:alpha-L-arabinofuranosidase
MHRPHVGATALTTVVQGGAVLPDGSPAVSATASRGKDGIAYTLINRHLDRAVAVSVSGLGLAPVRVTVLTGEPDAQNDVGRPDRIAPRPLEFHTVGDDDLRFTLPARSVVTAEFGDGQVQR